MATPSRACSLPHRITALAAGLALLSGCGSAAAGTARTSPHDRLPEAIRQAGVLRVGVAPASAPVVFRDAKGQVVGLDPDVAAALGKVLGLRAEFEPVASFGQLLPGLQAKKYDVAMSAITDTKQREEGVDDDGKQIGSGADFVDYFIAGISILVRKGNPDRISSLDDLCGRTVSVKSGTIHADLALRQQKACARAGRPLRILAEADDASALRDLRTGRAQVHLNGSPKAAYNARTVDGGQAFQVAGSQLEPRPYGIAVRPGDTQLRDALSDAVDAIIRSGAYDGILAKWQLADGEVQNAVVNGGT